MMVEGSAQAAVTQFVSGTDETPVISPQPVVSATGGEVAKTGKLLFRRSVRSQTTVKSSLEIAGKIADLDKIPPIPAIPDSLTGVLEGKLEQVIKLFRQKRFDQAQKQCVVLSNAVSDCAEAKNVKAFLDKIILLSQINMGNFTETLRLSTDNPQVFIDLHMVLAKCAVTGTKTLPISRELELYCYRQAADAGSQLARQLLVKDLLLCQGSWQPLFMPTEAIRLLQAMVAKGTDSLPTATDPYEEIINDLAKLLHNPDSDAREKLVKNLTGQPDPVLRFLCASLFTEPRFGPVDPDQALSLIPIPAGGKAGTGRETMVADMAAYWRAKALIIKGDQKSIGQAERTLLTLSERGFHAAALLLVEHYLHKQKLFRIPAFLHTMDRLIDQMTSLSPDLAFITWRLYEGPEQTLQGLRGRKLPADERKRRAMKLKRSFLQHCHPEGRAAVLMESCYPCAEAKNMRAIGSNEVKQLTEDTRAFLHATRFSEDPDVLVFLYFNQKLLHVHGRSDESLIELAMAVDPVRTCCCLLILCICTETLLESDLAMRLLKEVKGAGDLPDYCKKQPDLAHLISSLHRQIAYLPDPEHCFRLCSELINLREGEDPDSTGIHDSLKNSYARHLGRQGKEAEANTMYRQDWKAKTKYKSLLVGSEPMKLPAAYQVFRDKQPEYYWTVALLEPVSSDPAQVRCKFQQLMDTRESMQQDPNPAIHCEWIDVCLYFMHFSSFHLTADHVRKLTRELPLAIEKLQECNQVLWNRSRALLAQQARLLKGCSSLDELRNSSSQEVVVAASDGRTPVIRSPAFRTLDVVLEHHLEASLAEAKDAGERLEILQKCLDSGSYNTAAIIELAIKELETLPGEKQEEAARCLLTLSAQLQQDMDQFEEKMTMFTCRIVSGTSHIVEELKDLSEKQPLEDVLEAMKCRLMQEHPRQLADAMMASTIKLERPVWQAIQYSSKPLEEQLKVAMDYIQEPALFLAYAEYLKSRVLDSEEKAVLQQVCGKREFSIYRNELKFLTDFVFGNECKSHLLSTAGQGRVYADTRVALLQVGLEAQILSSQEVRKKKALFGKDNPYTVFLDCLTAPSREELLDGFSRMKEMYLSGFSNKYFLEQHFPAVGMKLLRAGEVMPAFEAFEYVDSSYHMAMMKWKSGCPLTGARVPERLLKSAATAHVDSQCRLIDWCLENKTTELLQKRCYRYLHSSVLVPSDERLLYQGIAEYKGLGAEADEQGGLEKIQAALQGPSPLPALRLAVLVQKGLLPRTISQDDLLTLFARKLHHYKGKLPDDLRLSISQREMNNLVTSLTAKAEALQDFQFAEAGKALSELFEVSLPSAHDASSVAVVKPARKKRRRKAILDTGENKEGQLSKPEKPEKPEKPDESVGREEEQVIKELSHLFRNMPRVEKSSRVVSLLKRLRVIQGERFPDITDEGVRWLLKTIFMVTENSDLIKAVVTGIDSETLFHEVMTGLLDGFLIRYDLSRQNNEPLESIHEERKALLQILPENMTIIKDMEEPLMRLFISFAPDFPKKVEAFVTRPENTRFLQLFLLRQPQITPATHNKLYKSHASSCASPRGGGATSVSEEETLQQSIFDDLSGFTSKMVMEYMLKSPVLSDVEKFKRFNKLDLTMRRECVKWGLPEGVCKGAYAEAAKLRHKLNLTDLIQKARNIASDQEQVNIVELLAIYLHLQNKNQMRLAAALVKKMKQASQKLLEQPLKDWDGNPRRIYAQVIDRLFV